MNLNVRATLLSRRRNLCFIQDGEVNMSKFNCAREYRLSKRRYDEMFVFRQGDGSQRFDSGLRLTSFLIFVLLISLMLMGFWV